MSRRQRRIRRRRGQAAGILMLIAAGLIVLTGLRTHLPGREDFSARSVSQPTATPVTSAFDETVVSRQVSLPADVWYAIQTGVYSSQEAALSRTDLYAERGAPGYAAEDGGKWRVFIACYGSRTDASAVRERLSTLQKVDTHLHEWLLPAVTLQLSGMAGQLDVAEAGLTLPSQTAALLRESAVALDAGESSMSSIRDSLASMDDSVTLWAKTARERFLPPRPVMVEQILSCTDRWTEQYRALRSAEAATALSAALKIHAMTCRSADSAIRAALLAE